MNFPFGETITLLKRTKTGTDSFGNDVFSDVSQGTLLGAYVPAGSVEQVQGQDVVTVQPSVLLPPDTDAQALTAIDALSVAGQMFEIDGVPNVWASPLTGRQFGVEVRLRRVTG